MSTKNLVPWNFFPLRLDFSEIKDTGHYLNNICPWIRTRDTFIGFTISPSLTQSAESSIKNFTCKYKKKKRRNGRAEVYVNDKWVLAGSIECGEFLDRLSDC